MTLETNAKTAELDRRLDRIADSIDEELAKDRERKGGRATYRSPVYTKAGNVALARMRYLDHLREELHFKCKWIDPDRADTDKCRREICDREVKRLRDFMRALLHEEAYETPTNNA